MRGGRAAGTGAPEAAKGGGQRVGQQRRQVVGEQLRQFRCGGPLGAAQLQRQLHALARQVVPVLRGAAPRGHSQDRSTHRSVQILGQTMPLQGTSGDGALTNGSRRSAGGNVNTMCSGRTSSVCAKSGGQQSGHRKDMRPPHRPAPPSTRPPGWRAGSSSWRWRSGCARTAGATRARGGSSRTCTCISCRA
jgi:hypothetical protein